MSRAINIHMGHSSLTPRKIKIFTFEKGQENHRRFYELFEDIREASKELLEDIRNKGF